MHSKSEYARQDEVVGSFSQREPFFLTIYPSAQLKHTVAEDWISQYAISAWEEIATQLVPSI